MEILIPLILIFTVIGFAYSAVWAFEKFGLIKSPPPPLPEPVGDLNAKYWIVRQYSSKTAKRILWEVVGSSGENDLQYHLDVAESHKKKDQKLFLVLQNTHTRSFGLPRVEKTS